MKKIFSLIALTLLCFINSANAQHKWVPKNGMEINVSNIQAGPEHYYVLKGGANTMEDGTPGKDIWGTQHYLSAVKQSERITHESVFNIIDTGETQGGHKVYVLKNVSNGKYLAEANASYETFQAKALKLTIQKGRYVEEDSITENTPWEEYSNAVSATRSQGAVEMGAWVICSTTEYNSYLSFCGNPAFAGWIDTNNWLIIPVEEKALSEYDKLQINFDKYFSKYEHSGDIQTTYPAGTEPGCISQNSQNYMVNLFTTAENLLMEGEGSNEAACKNANNAIIKFFEQDLTKAIVPVKPGYYVLKNVSGRGFLSTTGDGYRGRGNDEIVRNNVVDGTDYNTWTPGSVTTWDFSQAPYIWKLEPGQKEGTFVFQNFKSKRFLNTWDNFCTLPEISTSFNVNLFGNREFTITFNQNGMVHLSNYDNRQLLNYNVATDPASRWIFYPISEDIVNGMAAEVEQALLNEELNALVTQATTQLSMLQYGGLFIEGNRYNVPADNGLVSYLTGCNADAYQEGSREALFDGNKSTYYHTAWKESDVQNLQPGERHFIMVDMGQEVSDLIVKFSKRNAYNNHVSKYALYSVSGDNLEVAELVATSADSIEYQYGDTHIARYHFSKPVRELRFDVLKTRGQHSSLFDKMTAGTGPFWHMAEFRLYDAADIKESPAFTAVPQAIKDAVTTAINQANAELLYQQATQTTLDELNNALVALEQACPDASYLKQQLTETEEILTNTSEGESMGFFQTGAKATLQTTLDKINNIIAEKDANNQALSFEEIAQYETELDAAIAAFNAKLIQPESGKIYQIVCRRGYNEDGTERDNNDELMASANADINGNPMHRRGFKLSQDNGHHINTFWLVEKTQNGVAFKNLGNGLYLNNPYEDAVEEIEGKWMGYSKTPKSFTLEQFTAGNHAGKGYFLATLEKGHYLNFEQTGQMVHWYDRNDANSALEFIDVAAQQNYTGAYDINLPSNSYNIVTLPIDIQSVENGHYEVLGMQYNNQVELKKVYTAVKAGTPFIVKTGDNNWITVHLANSDLNALKNLKYNYESVTKNGLVSVPQTIVVEDKQTYGVFYGNTILTAEKGDKINAGTGYITNNISIVKEAGDVSIKMEGYLLKNTLSIPNLDVYYKGEDLILPVEMDNKESIIGFQFELVLPQGISVAKDDWGNLIEFAGGRENKSHVLTSNILPNGNLQVLCYSNNNSTFVGNQGKVINIHLTPDANFVDGTYPVLIKEVVLTNATDKKRIEAPQDDATITITSYSLGDVNNDGFIDVSDIASIVSFIMKNPTGGLSEKAADVNEDGFIDVSDIARIVDMILNGSTRPVALSTTLAKTTKVAKDRANIEILPFTLNANEEKTIQVLMNNPEDVFTGFQFDLYLPKGIQINGDDWGYFIGMDGKRTNSRVHTLSSAKQPDGSVRVLLYTTGSASIRGTEGAVLTMKMINDGSVKDAIHEIQIKNVVMTHAGGLTNVKPRTYEASVISGQPTEKEVVLKGHYTQESLSEVEAALQNQNITSVDFSKANTIDANCTFKTANPNALIYLAEGQNLNNQSNLVVAGNCAELLLREGYDFKVTKPFFAQSASYERTLASEGWYSVCLPYAAEIPFNAVVEEYAGINADQTAVDFTKADAMAANVPYIFKANGKTAFSANNVEVPATTLLSQDIFTGTLAMIPAGNVTGNFALRNDGSGFGICTAEAYMPAFRAYLHVHSNAQTIKINHDDVTGIEDMEESEGLFPADIYTVDGKLVKKGAMNLNGLSHGIYIINNKKVIK